MPKSNEALRDLCDSMLSRHRSPTVEMWTTLQLQGTVTTGLKETVQCNLP